MEEVDLGTVKSQTREGCVDQTQSVIKHIETKRQLLVINYFKEFQ